MSDLQRNLLGIPETHLPQDPAATRLEDGVDPRDVVRQYPTSGLAWAELAEAALADGDAVEAYAFARTGYHRSLDSLRRAGWRGQGPVPWSHVPNRGYLRAVAALCRAAEAFGEEDEVTRCRELLRDSDPEAVSILLGD